MGDNSNNDNNNNNSDDDDDDESDGSSDDDNNNNNNESLYDFEEIDEISILNNFFDNFAEGLLLLLKIQFPDQQQQQFCGVTVKPYSKLLLSFGKDWLYSVVVLDRDILVKALLYSYRSYHKTTTKTITTNDNNNNNNDFEKSWDFICESIISNCFWSTSVFMVDNINNNSNNNTNSNNDKNTEQNNNNNNNNNNKMERVWSLLFHQVCCRC